MAQSTDITLLGGDDASMDFTIRGIFEMTCPKNSVGPVCYDGWLRNHTPAVAVNGACGAYSARIPAASKRFITGKVPPSTRRVMGKLGKLSNFGATSQQARGLHDAADLLATTAMGANDGKLSSKR